MPHNHDIDGVAWNYVLGHAQRRVLSVVMVNMVLLDHVGALAHTQNGFISGTLAVQELFNFWFFALCFQLPLSFFLELLLLLFLFSFSLFLLLLLTLLVFLLLLFQPILLDPINSFVEIEIFCLQEFDSLVLLELKHGHDTIHHIPLIYIHALIPLERSRS
jgi:hypothetical protein